MEDFPDYVWLPEVNRNIIENIVEYTTNHAILWWIWGFNIQWTRWTKISPCFPWSCCLFSTDFKPFATFSGGKIWWLRAQLPRTWGAALSLALQGRDWGSKGRWKTGGLQANARTSCYIYIRIYHRCLYIYIYRHLWYIRIYICTSMMYIYIYINNVRLWYTYIYIYTQYIYDIYICYTCIIYISYIHISYIYTYDICMYDIYISDIHMILYMHVWYTYIDLSIYPSTHLSIYPSIHRSIHLSFYPSIYPSIHLSNLSIYLSIYVCIYVSIYLILSYLILSYPILSYPIYLSIYLSYLILS